MRLDTIRRVGARFAVRRKKKHDIPQKKRKKRVSLVGDDVEISMDGQYIEDWLEGRVDGHEHSVSDLEAVTSVRDDSVVAVDIPLDGDIPPRRRLFLSRLGQAFKAFGRAWHNRRFRNAISIIKMRIQNKKI